MSDPWSSLQAADTPADDGAGSVHPAYANYDDKGLPQVGFDVFMTLPNTCLKCAAPADTKRVANVSVEREALVHLLHRGKLSQSDDRVRSGKYKLDLPHCSACLSAYATSRRNFLVALFLPIVAIAAVIGLSFISASAAPIFFLVALVGVIAAMVITRNRYNKTNVAIAALDTDGFMVLGGVDIQAGEAIVAASGGV